jgi:hypothetical protein
MATICSHVNSDIFSFFDDYFLYDAPMYIEAVPNRNSPPAILLRESYRDNGRVGGDVATPTPHRPGRARFEHPVPHGRASLTEAYR